MNRRESIKTTSTVLAATLLGGCVTASSEANTSAKTVNDVWSVFEGRRSVRKFKSDVVPDEDIKKIIHAAHLAPNAGNYQNWKFLVIKNRGKLNQLIEITLKKAEDYFKQQNLSEEEITSKIANYKTALENYLSASVFIQVLIDYKPNLENYYQKDGALAAGYLMLAARALGYGSVFITDSFNYETIKEVFNIPDNYRGICFIPIGVPEEWPSKPLKKDISELIINEEF